MLFQQINLPSLEIFSIMKRSNPDASYSASKEEKEFKINSLGSVFLTFQYEMTQ